MAAAAAVVALAAVVSVYAQPSISASLSGGTWSVSFSGGAATYNDLQYSTSGGWTSMVWNHLQQRCPIHGPRRQYHGGVSG